MAEVVRRRSRSGDTLAMRDAAVPIMTVATTESLQAASEERYDSEDGQATLALASEMGRRGRQATWSLAAGCEIKWFEVERGN